MHEATEFLRNLAVVLCVAGATSVVFQRLRQPVVFGYLLAGLIVGPHLSVPIVADEAVVRALAELGVILVMFALGLEFRLRRLVEVAPTGGLIALSETSAMLTFGYLVGQLFGWTTLESIFAGAIVAISSTTVVVKAFDESGVRGRARETVFGVLVSEDLIAIFLVAILTAVATGASLSTGSLALTATRLAVFLVGLVGVGLLVVPRFVRFVVRLERPETTLVTCIGICFAFALLALEFGYSVALGAFIAGALVAESGQVRSIEHLVHPVRDLFAAIFFVAVGMLIDPAVIAPHLGDVVVLTLVVLVGKVVAVSMGAFLAGNDVQTATRTGMSIAQIGEFSFIIAGIGLSTGATRPFLYPVAIAVSAITTLTTPWLIRGSARAALFVDRKLPKPLQTFVALYGSWIEQLHTGGRTSARPRVRRATRLLLLDAGLLAGLAIGVSLELARIVDVLSDWMALTPGATRVLVLGGSILIAAQLVFGIVRNARVLAMLLALRAIPRSHQGVDLAAAPRRVLVIALQLTLVFLVGAPLLVITQPFLPPFRGPAILAGVLAILWIAFWRSATNLQGHARAGAEVIVAALEHQMADEEEEPATPRAAAPLERLHHLLPGLGEPVPVRIGAESPAAGRTLAELNLRGRTGATVLAIARDDGDVLLPVGKETLRPGDVLALAGAPDAIAAAEELLRAPAPVTHAAAPVPGLLPPAP